MSPVGQVRRFGKAVFDGTVFAGGLSCALVSAMVLMGMFGALTTGPELRGLLFLAFSPIWIALLFILLGSLCIGFPATVILRRLSKESGDAYGRIGCIAGLLMPLVIPLAVEVPPGVTLFLCLAGGAGGTTTARSWWKGRPQVPGREIE